MNVRHRAGTGRLTVLSLLAACVGAAWGGSRLGASLFALHLGSTPATVGILVALFSVFPMFASVAVGRTLDRVGAYRPVVVSGVVMAVALAIPFAFPGLPALFVSAALVGSTFIVCQLALLNSAARVGEPEDRTTNLGWLTTGFAAGGSIGPLITGVTIDSLGYPVSFLLMVPYAVVIVATFIGWRTLNRRAGRSPPPLAAPPGGDRRLADLLRAPRLRDTMVVGATLSATWDLFVFVVPVYGSEIGLSSSTIGAIMAAMSVSSLVVRMAMPVIVRGRSEWGLIAVMIGLSAVVYTIMPLVPGALAWTVLACAVGVVLGIGQPINHALIYAASPPGRQSEAMGVRMGMGHFMHVAAPISIGALSTTFGLAPVIWSLAASFYYATWFAYRRARGGAR